MIYESKQITRYAVKLLSLWMFSCTYGVFRLKCVSILCFLFLLSTWEPKQCAVMWPVFWTAMRTYAPYVTFPVAFVVGAVGYHLEWFVRGTPKPREEKGILELREERKLQEQIGTDSTQVLSLKDKLEFAPKAALNRNRPEKS